MINEKKLILITLLVLMIFIPLVSSAAQVDSAPTNGLVGYWSLDEGLGTVVHDSSGQKKNGTFQVINPLWVTGKRSKALLFDGVNSYVSGPPVSSSALTRFTVSAWIKPNGLQGQDVAIVTDVFSTAVNYALHFDESAYPSLRLYGGSYAGGWQRTPAATLPDGVWTFATFTYDGAALRLYINNNAALVTNVVFTPQSNNLGWRIGRRWDSSNIFKGAIDEVRIYNRALSSTEIATLYKSGAAKVSAQPKLKLTLDSGLVGYWTMDNQDINWNTNTMVDKSGNYNTSTLVSLGTTTAPVAGKLGGALKFDGNSNYASVANAISAKSVSFWVKPTTNTAAMINLAASAYVTVSSGAVSATGFDTVYVNGAIGATLSANKWNHIVATNATNISANAITIGKANGAYVAGSIDDVRIYNRALSAAEVKQLYSQGAGTKINKSPKLKPVTLDSGLVGYWTMDNQDINWTTNIITDESGNGNAGNLISLGTTTAPFAGKFGQALQFNGSTGYLRIPQSTSLNLSSNQLSISVWIYQNTTTSGKAVYLVRKGDVSTGFSYATPYHLSMHTSGIPYFGVANSSCSGVSAEGKVLAYKKWYHLVGVYDGNKAFLYINGSEISGGVSLSGNLYSTTQDLGINSYIDGNNNYYNYFPGLIDDVRIYNRALSATEVLQLYRQGK